MNAEWVSCIVGDLAKDPTLVQRGDLIQYELWETPDGPARYRALIKVAEVTPGSQVRIAGWEDTTYFDRDGAVTSTYSGYGSVFAARWDPIRVLRGGAPEIFEGERVDEVRAALDSYAAGNASFDDVKATVDTAVFSIGIGPGRNLEEVHRRAEEAPLTEPNTFDQVLWLPLLSKQITLDQRGELFELAHFTNGGGGRPRRPSSDQPDE
ncbi:hypothetical protein [Nakamurella multipartita]|uniref:Uncharacterized protein n=1 Tax=Nakamurella multipartita (strain ATCC 700099 / DSM 44233 / CIP 104796 / JCM 9543 / NBRC 105858 / Y-104) TaxID=479431 RepID=C8X721_NAKMY|nr:hypothetical protein [Nakamurella multipartita]ACV76890.1 hypothetical protein Namu_0471 [Nakamurella multipartita DSM 44233]